MTAMDFPKQQALDADPGAIQQINFSEIWMKQGTLESISFLKKQKKLPWNFHNEL